MNNLFFDDKEGLRWGVCGAVALLAHLAPAATYLSWHSEPPPLPPPAAMMIELAPLPAPPAPQPQPEPPPPQPKPQPKPKPKPIKPPPVAKRPEVALPEPEPVVQPTQPQTQTEQPAEPTPPASAPSGPISTDLLINYQQRLLAHLERHRHYPRASQLRRQQGVAQLRFTVDRRGRVLEYRIVQGSGFAALDQEVLAMIKRAQPLPEIPPELEKDSMELIVPVEFSLRRLR